ncbi:MAG: polysaccharide deacetylase family protein [Pseudomonadota bacterium]
MSADWTPLRHALVACRAQNIAVPFWWRDDDAVAPTPALDRLTDMARACGVPVHLAVIPSLADPQLARALDPAWMRPVVHGWAHADHSQAHEKKNEFLTTRSGAVPEAARALDTASALFGTALTPMFVPPWNRINAQVMAALPALGYRALSTFGARTAPLAAPGLTQINTHIDPIWWRGSRDLVDPDQLITQAAAHLDARRQGDEDGHEPLGLLTHHLVHSPQIWAFVQRFVQEMQDGGAAPWTMETDE